jgi:hypothetical protein
MQLVRGALGHGVKGAIVEKDDGSIVLVLEEGLTTAEEKVTCAFLIGQFFTEPQRVSA